jgi:tripartite-type tricarboxylate transporter receptor subunit TctC
MFTQYILRIIYACIALHIPYSWSEDYPIRPISLVVPFAAGGPVDTTARIIAQGLQTRLGQPVIVENLGGAAGNLASAKVAGTKPDGYTLMLGIWGTHVANGAIYKSNFDIQKDFKSVGLISYNPLIVIVSKNVPANNLNELISWLKANPNKASQGTSGIGSIGHLAGIMFQRETKTTYQFVPYRGLAPAMQDLLAGNIDLMFDSPATSLQYLKSGKIKAIALTSNLNLSTTEQIPTFSELGYPNLGLVTWSGIFAPKKTSPEVITKLNQNLALTLADPNVQTSLKEVGQIIYPKDQLTPQYLESLQQKEIEKWWPIIKEANINSE